MEQSVHTAYRQALERGDGPAVAVHLAGVGLCLLGFFLFVASRFPQPNTGTWWLLREAAGVAGAVGVVAALLGATVAGSHRYAEMAGGGAIAALVGVVVFVAAYPAHWNTVGPADLTLEGVTVFAVGVCALLAAAGATAMQREGPLLGERSESTATSEFDWVGETDAEQR